MYGPAIKTTGKQGKRLAITGVVERDIEGERDYYTTLAEGTVGLRTFIVESNNVNESEEAVLAGLLASSYAVGPLTNWPSNPFCLCYKLHPTRPYKDRMHWRVVCDYKTIFNSQEEIQRATISDPTARPTVSSGQARTVMVPVRRCLRTGFYHVWSNSNAFTMTTAANSANDPLDPPIMVPSTEWEFRFQKNVATLPTWVTDETLGYQDGVNASDQAVTVGGVSGTIKSGRGKLSNIGFGEQQRENGYTFYPLWWNVTVRKPRPKFSIESDEIGPWDEERLDEGMRTSTKDMRTGALSFNPVLDDGSPQRPVSLPVPFNGAGNRVGVAGTSLTENDLLWACYRPFGPRVNYSVIPWT